MIDWPAWVIAAQNGDLGAFEQLVVRFQGMAVSYAYSVLGDFYLAEDAAQEAFLQAYRDLVALREPQAFPAWLKRIVFTQCDRITRRKVLPLVSFDAGVDLADPGKSPLEVVQQRETRDEVLAAVNALPEGERAATALYYINGYSVAEVGEFLEVPAGTVKKRLFSARQRLQKRMVGLVEETMKRHAPGKTFARRVRSVLEGIPRIGFQTEEGPKGFFFPAALEACLRFLGGDPAFDYTFLMGVSGTAFGLLWGRAGQWWYNHDLTDLAGVDWPEPIARAFAAVGYDYEIVTKEDGRDNEAYFRKLIVESIREGRPVLASGVVGPPCTVIVSGYDEDGNVLIGWSHFQDYIGHNTTSGFEKSGYFRKLDWFADTPDLTLIGKKTDAPPLTQTYCQALAWAVQVMRQPTALDRDCGLNAYTAWAEHLLRDEDFPADDGVLMERLDVHFGCFSVAAEGRWYAARFLRRIKEHEPALADELEQAAICFEAETGALMEISSIQGGFGPHDLAVARKLADPEVRGRVAEAILKARAKDEEAAAHIERALLICTS